MVPSKAIVVQWATAIGEPVNKWLALAGYEPLPGEGTNDITSDPEGAEEAGEPALRLRHPEPPPEVLEAINEAPTREEKVRQAVAYLQRPELRLRFGSDGGASTEHLIQIVR